MKIRHTIEKGPHPSITSPESKAFFRGGILEKIQRGFSIFLTEKEITELFRTNIHISCLASVDQINHKLRLICNSGKNPDYTTLSVNTSMDKTSEPRAMQFGDCLACLIQKI